MRHFFPTTCWRIFNNLGQKSFSTDSWGKLGNSSIISILLYGCTTWTLTKRLEKKLDGNYTRMLRAILNKSWRQHPTRHQLTLPPITKTIQVRRTRHAGHCWRSRDDLMSDVLLWTPTYGRAKAGRPARTYIQQLCEDTGCNPEDLPEAMNDREKWRERVSDIRASGTTWWWWWWLTHTRRRNTPFTFHFPTASSWLVIFIYEIHCWRVQIHVNIPLSAPLRFQFFNPRPPPKMSLLPKSLWSIMVNCTVPSFDKVHQLPNTDSISELLRWTISIIVFSLKDHHPIYPTPPLGQDMTQGQFF